MKTILLAALLFTFTAPISHAQEEEHPFAKAIGEKLVSPKKKFTLMVRVTVKEGQAEKFIAAFAEAVEPTRKEEGCSRYELNQINGETNSFVVYERWANLERLKAHLATPHTKKLLETIMPLVDGHPEIVVLTPQAEPKKEKKDPAGDPEKKPEAK